MIEKKFYAGICGYPHTVKGGNMWVDPQKRECYGKLFPDASLLDANALHGGELLSGEVFGFRRNSFGIGTQPIEFTVDEAKWERCTECPHYRTCYDLSMAMLAFKHAVGRN